MKKRLDVSGNPVPTGLLDLIARLVPYAVRWGTSSSDPNGDRHEVPFVEDANAISSRLRGRGRAHALVLDIDHPAWLIPSSTPGHYHLYIDVPDGIRWREYKALLEALADAGVVEQGYANVNIAREATFVRLPWVRKD